MSYIANCVGCPYGGRAVGPRGDPGSRIVLVGEAPGAVEIEVGEPFRGRAGDVLRHALLVAEVSEASVFITNAVACLPHPVHPHVGAIDRCQARLTADLEMHRRDVIVTLGATAVRAVTGVRGFRVTLKAAHTQLSSDWGPVIPTLHPAFVRRRGLRGPEYQTLIDDLRQAQAIAATPAD